MDWQRENLLCSKDTTQEGYTDDSDGSLGDLKMKSWSPRWRPRSPDPPRPGTSLFFPCPLTM